MGRRFFMAINKSGSVFRSLQVMFIHPVYFLYCIYCGMKTVVKMASSFARYGIWRTGVKRFVKGEGIQGGLYRWWIPDSLSFYFLWEEIFEKKRIYDFNPRSGEPLILDAGANVGASVIFFKERFPRSRVIAFEADPEICSYLRRNIEENHIPEVEIHNEAVWVEDCILNFQQEGADGGHLETSSGESGKKTVPIQAKDFRKVLQQYSHIDFLKMDIEGAENFVVPHLDGALEHVDHIFIEYHQFKNSAPGLSKILSVLEKASFAYVIKGGQDFESPFLNPSRHPEFSLQLEIFAWRKNSGEHIKS